MIAIVVNRVRPLCLAVACLLGGAVGTFAAESDEDIVVRLREIWDRQRREVATAEIQFLSVRRPAKAGLKRADVLKLLDQAKLPGTEKSLKKFVAALDPTLAGMTAPWSIKDLYFDGQNIREDLNLNLPGTFDTHVRTEQHEVRTNRVNDQIDIVPSEHKGSRYRLTSLGDLRFVPSDHFADRALVVDRKSDGRVVLQSTFEQVVADDKSGFVYEFRRSVPQSTNVSEIYQFGPTEFGEGNNVVVLPTARLDAKFRDDTLTRFELTAILAANVNVEVPGEMFFVAGNKGTTVVDYREGESVERLEKNFPDVTKRD